MADKDKAQKLRDESRSLGTKTLKHKEGFPVSPLKAMSSASRQSKGLRYPIGPYASANIFQLLRWTQAEWNKLGQWQRVAAPVIVLVALLTWEKEQVLKEERWFEIDKATTKHYAARMYGAFGERKKRKLFGIIPLPGGR